MARNHEKAVRGSRVVIPVLAAAMSASIAQVSASADDSAPTLDNGGFESGTVSGWHVAEKGGAGEGWSVIEGRTAPFSGLRIPAPPEGRWQAVSDQTGPGSHVLYRDLVVGDEEAELTLTVWYRNRASRFFTPRTLAPHGSRNQQLRVDLIRPGAKVRSMSAGDILVNVFRTRRGDASRMLPTSLHEDLSAYEGRTVRLRIAEVDNQGFFQAGLDDVQLVEALDDQD